MIYEPAEDTFLLAEAVKKYARGRVLEIGTGSGYLAAEAAKKATHVLAVDINSKAVAYCKKKYQLRNVLWKQSDLFSCVTGKFDTIIFNPPYLPYDRREPKESQRITTGGKHGYELLVLFLKECSNYLSTNGKAFVVFSSLTNQQKIDTAIMEAMLTKNVVLTKKIAHEILYVYHIVKSPLHRKLERKGITHLVFFTQGKRGMIYTGQYHRKKIAVKIHHPLSLADDALAREAKILPLVNKLGIGPRFLFGGKKYVVYLFVDGEHLLQVFSYFPKRRLLKIIADIYHQLFLLDNACIAKEEMSNPYKHIIITLSGKPVLLDFERAHRTQRPHNVTQFCSYLIRLQHILHKKGISLQPEMLVIWAKLYRHGDSSSREHQLNKLIQLLSS